MKKYDVLKTITPKEAANRKIEDSQEEWFEEFSERSGYPGKRFEFIDDYKKDPDMKGFLHEWQKFYTHNKEAVYDLTIQKYNKIKADEKEDIYQYEKQMDAKRREMKEIAEQEQEKNDPKEKEKKLIELAKAKEDILDASPDMKKALEFKIKRLESELGVEPEEKRGESAGLKNEDKMRAHLESKGYSPEQVEATIKEYLARKGQ